MHRDQRVYILGGPAGVGKTTVGLALASQLGRSVHIRGDSLYNFVVGGFVPASDCSHCARHLRELVWKNILSLTVNYLQSSYAVVIDYISFPRDVLNTINTLRHSGVSAEVHYVVLSADPSELLKRDTLRAPQDRMGLRCIELLAEYQSASVPPIFVIDTTELSVDQIVRQVLGTPAASLAVFEDGMGRVSSIGGRGMPP